MKSSKLFTDSQPYAQFGGRGGRGRGRGQGNNGINQSQANTRGGFAGRGGRFFNISAPDFESSASSFDSDPPASTFGSSKSAAQASHMGARDVRRSSHPERGFGRGQGRGGGSQNTAGNRYQPVEAPSRLDPQQGSEKRRTRQVAERDQVGSSTSSKLQFLRNAIRKWETDQLLHEMTGPNRANWEMIAGQGCAFDSTGELLEEVLSLLARPEIAGHPLSKSLYLPMLSAEGMLALQGYVTSGSLSEDSIREIVDIYGRGSGDWMQAVKKVIDLIEVITVVMRTFAEHQTKFGILLIALRSIITVLTSIAIDDMKAASEDQDEAEPAVNFADEKALKSFNPHLPNVDAARAYSTATHLCMQFKALSNFQKTAQATQRAAARREAERRAGEEEARRAATVRSRAGVAVLDDPARDTDFLNTPIVPLSEELLDTIGPTALPVNLVSRARRVLNSAFDQDGSDEADHVDSEVAAIASSSSSTELSSSTSSSSGGSARYRSNLHLLNTHYLLLRQDCLSQLREGITTFKMKLQEAGAPNNPNAMEQAIKQMASIRSGNRINVYSNVGVVDFDSNSSSLGYIMEFTIPGNPRVDWTKSSRLMQGSLLCLISGFKMTPESVILGTVSRGVQAIAEQTPTPLRVGPRVCISIDPESVKRFDPAASYVILESPVYFEAYRHVLAALQSAPQRGSLPFESILLGHTRDIPLPSYLFNPKIAALGSQLRVRMPRFIAAAASASASSADASELVERDRGWKMTDVFPGFEAATGSQYWDPRTTRALPEFECNPPLDQSQVAAITLALSKGLALIQGPPGCGKTYVGVIIARLLLSNKALRAPKPILFVCQTNHALDQMLEHVHKFDQNIIRVGGRSQSEIMKNLTLFNKRQTSGIRIPKDDSFDAAKQDRDVAFAGLRSAYVQRRIVQGVTAQEDGVIVNSVVARLRTIVKAINYNTSESDESKSEAAAASLSVPSSANPIDIIMQSVSASEQQAWDLMRKQVRRDNSKLPDDELPAWSQGVENWKSLSVSQRVNILAHHGRGSHTAIPQILETWANQRPRKQKRNQGAVEMDQEWQVVGDARQSMTGPEQGTSSSSSSSSSAGDELADFEEDLDAGAQQDRNLDDEELVFSQLEEDDDGDHTYDRREAISIAVATRTVSASEFEAITLHAGLTTSELEFLRRFDVVNKTMSLSIADRQHLVNLWLRILQADAIVNIKRFTKLYHDSNKVIQDYYAVVDAAVLRTASVIGMTTSGGAKYNATLQSLGCEVVVVEEAAEVLEAHILASLTPSVKHMILIGDHFQLRPQVSVYQLQRYHALDVSMFERLANSGVLCVTLTTQRRMHPEISSLIRPAIYRHLIDDESTLQHPPVGGMPHRLFFWSHTVPEDGAREAFGAAPTGESQLMTMRKFDDSVSGSHTNTHEARLLVRLMQHLVFNGYNPERIVVLTMYKGQTMLVRRLAKEAVAQKGGAATMSRPITEIRVTTTDNFQGEEADIILLSLVRSNLDRGDGVIGFLEASNRVNVGLSRARHGMIVLGNFDLMQHKSDIWRRVCAVAQLRGQFGPALPLQCPNHPQSPMIHATRVEDFSLAPHGGCMLPCGGVFDDCGHSCDLVCHPCSHDQLLCPKACIKPRPAGCTHACPKPCYEECGPCKVVIMRTRSGCNHSFRAACGADIDAQPCPVPCGVANPCGHACKEKCDVRRPHSSSNHPCKTPCERVRATCAHACQNKCSEVCGPCEVLVEHKVSCGHTIRAACSELDANLVTKCQATCVKTQFDCGHFCSQKCNQKCDLVCTTMVLKPLTKCTAEKQHTVLVPCNENVSEKPCTQPCNAKLACGHLCTATCAECTSSGHHVVCNQTCARLLPCNHRCNSAHPCSTPCPPCASPCQIGCLHRPGGCGRTCAEPCQPCKKQVRIACAHAPQRPPAVCCEAGSTQSDSFCELPCPMMLRCGHPCLGICGETCPIICATCHQVQFCKVLPPTLKASGTANPASIRLLQLACGHVFESGGIFAEVQRATNADTPSVPACPVCLKSVNGVMRFKYAIAQATLAVQTANFPVLEQSMRSEVETDLKAGLADLVITRLHAILRQRGNEFKSPLSAIYHILLGDALLAKLDAPGSKHNWRLATELAVIPRHRSEAFLKLGLLELGIKSDFLNPSQEILRSNMPMQALTNARLMFQSAIAETESEQCRHFLSTVDVLIERKKLEIRKQQEAAKQQREAQQKAAQAQAARAAEAAARAADRDKAAAAAAAAAASDRGMLEEQKVQSDDQKATFETLTATEVLKAGGSALHLAARRGDVIGIELLLQDGADSKQVDSNGDTALHLAVRFRHLPAVRVLLPVSSWASVSKTYRATAVEEALFQNVPTVDGKLQKVDLADSTAQFVRKALQDALEGVDTFNPSKPVEAGRQWAAMRALESAKSEALDDLMAMTGLQGVKSQALKLLSAVRMDLLRPESSRTSTKQAMNFVFTGNPGTGKTTVARLFGKMLQEIGLRDENGAFVETSGQKLLADGSAKFKATLESATPGVLFVDEVYQLDPVGNGDGRAITNAIMEATENDRTKLTVIVAGYADDVREKWLASNDGLPSRFPFHIHFDDFNESELRSIFLDNVRSAGWFLEKVPVASSGDENATKRRIDVSLIAASRLARNSGRRGFANARSVRVLVETAQRRASERLMAERARQGSMMTIMPPEQLSTLTRRDILGQPLDPDSSPLLKKLFRMTGLGAVKQAVRSLVQLATDNFAREEAGLPPLDVSLHRLFLGNPGTGKTTVAKMYGQVLREMGFLSNGEVILVGASKLTGSFVGSTATQVNRMLDDARGKVLVIDEAYVLAESTYGKEALNTLVERVQGTPGEDFAVLLCGYDSQMAEMFRTCNPGLQRRWRMEDAFHFDDYTDDELVEIMLQQATDAGVNLKREVAVAATREVLAKQRAKPNFGNAGAVRNLLDSVKERMSRRVREHGGNPLDAVLIESDFFERKAPDAAREALRKLVNAEPILQRIEQVEKQIKAQKARGVLDPKKLLKNWRFVGPPGTGKTTVARAFGEVFHKLGLLPDTRVVECKALDLLASYVGQTAPLVNAKMHEARGGVLFIDEAYAFCESPFGSNAIDALVGNMTDPAFEGNMIIIVAGYHDRIDDLMNKNAGLRSRFTEQIEFSDWSPQHCLELVRSRCRSQNVDLDIGADKFIIDGFASLLRLPGWANARDAVTVSDKLLESRDLRCDENGHIDGPLLLQDVRNVFDEMLRQRTPAHPIKANASSTQSRQLEPPPAVPVQLQPAFVAPRTENKVEVKAEEEIKQSEAPPAVPAVQMAPISEQVLLSSLEQAVKELGYTLERQRDVVRNGVSIKQLPDELLRLVASKVGSSEARVLPMLLAQCPPLLPRLERAVADEAAEREAQRLAAEAIAAAESAALAKQLAEAEAERQRQRMSAWICVYCGLQGCSYMPRLFTWNSDESAPTVTTIAAGSVQLRA